MPLYDENGRVIGQIPQKKEPNFLQQILGSFLNPADRLVRGSYQAAARTGTNLAGAQNPMDVLQGLIGERNNSSKINFLSDYENEQYKNPLNIAKDVASVSAPFVPGTGIVPLLGSGALAGFGGTYGQNDFNSTATGTVTGGATAGALGILGKGLSKLLGGGQGNKFTNFLKKSGTGLEESSVPMVAGKTVVDPEAARTALVSRLNEAGLDVSSKGINQLKQLGRDNKLVALATKEKEVIPLESIFTDDFTKQLRRVAANKGMDPDEVVSDYIQRFRNNPNAISLNPSSRGLPYAELDNIKGDFYRSAKELNNQSSALDDIVYNQLKKVQETGNPALSKANKDIAMASSYYKPTLLQETRGGQTASTSPIEAIIPFRQIINNQVKRGAAKVMKKTASFLEGSPVIQKTSKTGTKLNKLSNLLQNPKIGPIIAPLLQGSQVAPAFAGDQGLPAYDTNQLGFDPAQLGYPADLTVRPDSGSGIVNQLLASGMKISDIKALQDIGAIPKPTAAAKEPSTAEKKQQAQVQAGKRGVEGIQSIISRDPNVLQKSVLPEFFQDENTKAFKNYVNSAAESYGRLQSGGAINKEEEQRFKDQIYSVFASPTSQQQKLQILNQYFTDFL